MSGPKGKIGGMGPGSTKGPAILPSIKEDASGSRTPAADPNRVEGSAEVVDPNRVGGPTEGDAHGASKPSVGSEITVPDDVSDIIAALSAEDSTTKFNVKNILIASPPQ